MVDTCQASTLFCQVSNLFYMLIILENSYANSYEITVCDFDSFWVFIVQN